MKKQMDILKDSIKSVFFKYLLPSISATLVTSIYILADTIMIGRGVGADGIAALNIVLPIFNLFFGTGLLFGVGGGVLMSMRFGQNQIVRGQNYFTTAVFGCAVMAVVYWIVFGLALEPALYMLGATEQTFAMAKEYGQILVAAVPVFIFSTMLQTFVRNDKAPTTAMIGVIAGGVTNVVLDYVFIFWCKMGIRGGVVATVMGTTLTILILCTHFFSKNNHLKLTKHGVQLYRLGRIAMNGFASFLVEVSGGVVVCMFNLQLVKYVGDIGITVYGIISNSALVAMSLANGVAQAAQPIAATNYGAGQHTRVKEVRNLGLIVTLAIGMCLFLAGFLFPEMITGIFVSPTEEIMQLSVPAVRIYFIAFVMMTANIFMSNFYQATNRAAHSLVIGLMRGLVLNVALVLFLPLILGVNGIWAVMPIVELLTIGGIVLLERNLHR